MASILSVEQLQGLAAGSTPNTITIPSGQTLYAPGHNIQTQFGTIPGTEISSTANTYADIGLQTTITPKVQTSKMLINIMFPVYLFGVNNTAEPRGSVRIVRSIGGGSFASNMDFIDNSNYSFKQEFGASNFWCIDRGNFIHYDTPNTTSAVIYKVQFKNTAGNVGVVRVASSNTTGNSPRMSVQEIAQ